MAQRIKTLVTSLLIAGFLYANVASICNYPLSLLTSHIRLPLPVDVYDAFLLFGVFSSYETINRDIEIYGITRPEEGTPDGTVVSLPTADYFPFSRGTIQSRTHVLRHGFSQGPGGEQRALEHLATKIRDRYNRDHAQKPIEKVIIVEVTWPRAFKGYETLRSNESLRVLFSQ